MSTASATFTKDPDATLDYGVAWTDWLVDGDTITTSTWEADSDEVTLTQDSHDDTTTIVWVSGGESGSRVRLTNRVTTDQGRVDDRSITLLIRHK